MIDVVGLIETISDAAGYKFVYGSNPHLNTEIKRLDTSLKSEEVVLALLPVREDGEIVQGTVNGYFADFIIMLGRKYETSTHSSVAETYKQKYERRLADLKGMLETFVQSISCSGYMELISVGYDNVINKFSANIDATQAVLRFYYENDDTGDGFTISPPLPETIDWDNVTNKPSPLMTVDWDDIENKPDITSSSKVGFSASDSSSSIYGGGNLTFDIEHEDTNDAFDGTIFTVPETGTYIVSGSVTQNALTNQDILGRFHVNGFNKAQFGRTKTNGTLCTISGSAHLKLTAGDELKLYAFSMDSQGAYPGEAFCKFSAYKV